MHSLRSSQQLINTFERFAETSEEPVIAGGGGKIIWWKNTNIDRKMLK